MQILKVLVTENAAIAYRDLSDNQTLVLMRIAAGKTSYDTASPREQGIMDELAELGLVSDLSYEATPTGLRVADMANRYGPRDARRLAQRNAAAGVAPVKGDGRYSEVGDASDNIEDDTVAGVTGRGLGIGGRPNRDNAI